MTNCLKLREKFHLPNTEAGLILAMHVVCCGRKAGHKARLTQETLCGFVIQVVTVTLAAKPTREQRGCFLRGAR